MDIPQLNKQEALELLSNGAIMIDVRRPEEREAGYIKGSLWIPLSELDEARLVTENIQKDQPIILQCRSGGRSQRAAEALLKWGYLKVFNLDGGIIDWMEEV